MRSKRCRRDLIINCSLFTIHYSLKHKGVIGGNFHEKDSYDLDRRHHRLVPSENGLKPELSARELLNLIEGDYEDIECVDLFSMDSSNIQPEEWITIAEAVKEKVDSCDGIVITHGTDTMAYTASMLSFMLAGITVPVVVTGAQHPAVYPSEPV